MTKFLNISTDTTLGGNSASDDTVSSQKAVKAYVDSQTGTAPAFANITGQPTDNANLATALNSKADDSTVVHKTGTETITGFKTLSAGAKITTSQSGAILELESAASGTNLLLKRTNGSTCVLESGGYIGLFGTSSNHPLQIRTNYVNRMEFGTNGSVTLATAPNENSNDNQVATTAWTNSKIPTVNNATFTIQKNGTTVNTFTANASSNVTANISVPTKTSDLTNDDGFITGINSNDVTTALGYTPVNPSNLATVATSGNYNDLSNKPTIPAAQVNSDWNASSGVAQILNKPTLGTMASESASDYTPTSGLSAVATSGSYNDLSNKPTIPTVNDASITIQKNGSTISTFTLNQASNDTINISVPNLSEGKDISLYTELSYISSTGGQYIDTGLVFNSNYTYKFKYQRTSNFNTPFAGFRTSSSASSGQNCTFTYISPLDDCLYYAVSSSSSSGINMGACDNNIHEIIFCPKDSILLKDNVSRWNSSFLTSQIISTQHFYIFNDNRPSMTTGLTGNFFSYQVLDGDTLIQNLIPCKRNSDNAIGMYDTVSGEFLTNSGTGNFSQGLETGYVYIGFNNNSGYITGITSSDVTTALGYTPYNSTNPAGYTSNVGTVTSVNNVSPVSGNVTLSIPTVNDATLTITQGGTTKGTFTANASSNATIDLDAGSSVDNSTISLNSSDELQTIAVKNRRDNSTLPIWQGTEAQWNQGEATTWYYWQTNVTGGWISGNLPSSDYWQGIAYGSNRFVITSSQKKSAYSTDGGETWTAGGNLPNGANNIAYGDGVFVAVLGFSNKTSYSTDGGETWTAGGNLPFSLDLNAKPLAFGNGVFVCVGSSKIAYSTNHGVSWSSVSLSNNPRDIGFDGEYFILTGGGFDTSYYSQDGVTWTQGGNLPSSSFWDVNYSIDNKYVVANSNNGTTTCYTTDHGVTWTEGTSFPHNMGDVACSNNVIVGIYTATGSTISYYSTDGGETWTASTMQDNQEWKRLAADNNGKFVAIGISSDKSNSFSIDYHKCYTVTDNPTTTSTVYSAPENTSSYTITGVSSGAITLSDNNTYYYNQSGNQYTYRTIGVAHPDWLCFINNVGVKIGNIIIATNNSNS